MLTAAACGQFWSLKELFRSFEQDSESEATSLELQPALYAACKRGFTDIVRVLREKGADLRKHDENNHGMTALHHASFGGHLETVRYLLNEGADPMIRDDYEKAPSFYASMSGNQDIVGLLAERSTSSQCEKNLPRLLIVNKPAATCRSLMRSILDGATEIAVAATQ
ncbi:ankyrin repeat-containing domain protein [Xylariaceae sp. FL1272]|nr:ankyrin repeat-containing domain protein [Xylariaceae sp. FL1272]